MNDGATEAEVESQGGAAHCACLLYRMQHCCANVCVHVCAHAHVCVCKYIWGFIFFSLYLQIKLNLWAGEVNLFQKAWVLFLPPTSASSDTP